MSAREEVLTQLNDQMNFEFYSAHIYLGMASYCASIGFKGFENWFKVQYEEEIAHAMKFFDYINSRGGTTRITGFADVKNEYNSLEDVLKSALKHEEHVTEKIQKIAKFSLDNSDLTSFSFIQWFIDEQVEEEETINDLIDDLSKLGNEGVYLLDKELATRTFVPIEQN